MVAEIQEVHARNVGVCLRTSLHRACPFFEAFGKAIVIKPDDLLTERTMGVGDKICWTMFVMWQDIERLESVAQLHRIFEQALKPKGIVVKSEVSGLETR